MRDERRRMKAEGGTVCADFALTAADGKTYQTVCYNLDVIVSVGYRVKSHRGRVTGRSVREGCLDYSQPDQLVLLEWQL